MSIHESGDFYALVKEFAFSIVELVLQDIVSGYNGYNDNTIRIQRSVSCQSGNTRGRKDKRKAWFNVTDDPLPKRKKK